LLTLQIKTWQHIAQQHSRHSIALVVAPWYCKCWANPSDQISFRSLAKATGSRTALSFHFLLATATLLVP
jgi:hypothetical protein